VRITSQPAANRFRGSLTFLKVAFVAALLIIPVVGFTGMQLENHDNFCASCHTNPESEYVDRAHAGTAVDLASFHTGKDVRCIDCHSGKGAIGRIQAMSLGGHDLLKFVSGHFPQPAPLTRSINDADCTKCHSDISQGRSFNNHFHFFLPQWQQLSDNAATCVDCHRSHTTDGMVQNTFLNEQHTVSICQQCHNFAGGRG
jgi:nitrate/TMAO reductase-like tetraheme cytochrome c subunit